MPRMGTMLSITRFLALGVPFLLLGWWLSRHLEWDGLRTIPTALIAASAIASVVAVTRASRLFKQLQRASD